MQPEFSRGLYVSSRGSGPLHVLIYKQEAKWVCHCLEYDISGESDSSQEAAFIQMKRVIEDLFNETRGLRSKTPGAEAPAELWQAWNSAPSSRWEAEDKPPKK